MSRSKRKQKEECIPNYLSHTATNCLVGSALTAYGFYGQTIVDTHWVTVASLSFLTATFLLSPDLDLRHSIPTKNWGILKIIWWGYSKIFRHRGHSHSLIFSSLTKLVYLMGVAFLALCLFEILSHLASAHTWGKAVSLAQESVFSVTEQTGKILIQHKTDVFAAYCGLVLNDWTHIIADRFYSALRKAS